MGPHGPAPTKCLLFSTCRRHSRPVMPCVHSGPRSSLSAFACGEIGFDAAKIGLLGAGISRIGRLIGPIGRIMVFPFTDFWQKSSGFWQNSSENRHAIFWKKMAKLSVKPAEFWSSRFSLFLRCLRCVSVEIFPNFTDFFQKLIKSVRSDFPPSTEFSNTAEASQRRHEWIRCDGVWPCVGCF
jgi:hypothetical protein